MKGFDMFDSCMDEETIEKLDATPLLELIKEYGSWNVTDGNWTEDSWDFMDTFVKIQKYLSIAPLFNMYVSADLKDSTKNIIVVSYPSLSWQFVQTDPITPNIVGTCCVRLHIAKCLTGFKLCAITTNNTQQHATGCANGRNITSNNVGSCWPTMSRNKWNAVSRCRT